MEGFKQQLNETKAQLGQMSSEYPDLSPDQQRDCLKRLEDTMNALQKIRGGLVEAERRTASSSHVLQVTGLHSERQILTAAMLENSFRFGSQYGPVGLSLVYETNYHPDIAGKLQKTDDVFVQFKNDRDMEYVLGKEYLNLKGYPDQYDTTRVTFFSPSRTSATRKTFREIGMLVERLEVIEEEYKEMGATREGGSAKPVFPSHWVNKQWLQRDDYMPKWKRAQSGGKRDYNGYPILKSIKIKDMDKLRGRVDALFDEEYDILLKLREFQLNGFEFDF